MSDLLHFFAGMATTLLIVLVAHIWAGIKARRNKGFTYSKALKRSLKTFNPFNTI
jgi:hypothetical protein